MSENKDDIATVEFQIGKWATDFMQKYLKFMGSNETIEDVARDAFFDAVYNLGKKLTELPHQREDDFANRFPDVRFHITNTEISEAEKQNDC